MSTISEYIKAYSKTDEALDRRFGPKHREPGGAFYRYLEEEKQICDRGEALLAAQGLRLDTLSFSRDLPREIDGLDQIVQELKDLRDRLKASRDKD